MTILRNHGKANENEAAINWFNSEKSRLESEMKSENGKLVNQEEFFEDYFEGKKDNVTSAINNLFGFGGASNNNESRESE